jgi:hypothetical protein
MMSSGRLSYQVLRAEEGHSLDRVEKDCWCRVGYVRHTHRSDFSAVPAQGYVC